MARAIIVGPVFSVRNKEKIGDPVICHVKVGPKIRFHGVLSRRELSINMKLFSQGLGQEGLRPGERRSLSKQDPGFTADEMVAALSLRDDKNLVTIED